MVIDETGTLHEGIADRAADEAKPAAFQILVHGVGFWRGGGNIPQGAWPRPAGIRRKLPDVRVEGAERVASLEESLGVRDCGGHLETVADDPGIVKKAGDVVRSIAGDDGRIETVERANERLPLAQDRRPGETRLESLEDQPFEEIAVVMARNAPLLVMVGDHQGIGSGPFATEHTVRRVPDFWCLITRHITH